MPIPLVETKLSLDLSVLTGISERADDLRPVWLSDVQPIVTDFLTQQFDSEGAYGGEPWADLAPATLALRQRPGHGRGGIGRDTNTLWASLVKSGGSVAAPGGLLSIGKQVYERGSAVRWAQWFAGGYRSTTKPVPTHTGWVFVHRASPKSIPARPIFPEVLPVSIIERISDAVRVYVGGAS